MKKEDKSKRMVVIGGLALVKDNPEWEDWAVAYLTGGTITPKMEAEEEANRRGIIGLIDQAIEKGAFTLEELRKASLNEVLIQKAPSVNKYYFKNLLRFYLLKQVDESRRALPIKKPEPLQWCGFDSELERFHKLIIAVGGLAVVYNNPDWEAWAITYITNGSISNQMEMDRVTYQEATTDLIETAIAKRVFSVQDLCETAFDNMIVSSRNPKVEIWRRLKIKLDDIIRVNGLEG